MPQKHKLTTKVFAKNRAEHKINIKDWLKS